MPYRAGAAVRDISPSRELLAAKAVWLWGYGNRASPCEGVHSPLTTRALAILDDEGNIVVLVTIDSGMLSPDFTARIRTQVHARWGVPPENLCINVSHTHGAPVAVSLPTWQLGVAAAHPAYAEFLENQVFRVIGDALQRAVPARLTWARGETGIGRDRHFKGEMRFYDATLDVLVVTSAAPTTAARRDGRAGIATIFIAPCHPVCNGELNRIYADFPGIARDAVELELGGIALFLQGYSGTCVPDLIDGQRPSEELVGCRLAADVIAAARGAQHELAGPLSARLHTVDLPFESVDPASLPSIQGWSEGLRADKPDFAELVGRWTRHIASLVPVLPQALPTQQQAICIGTAPNDAYLVASSHEVSMDFGPRVRSLWRCPRVGILGYSNSQCSYLPSARAMQNPYAAADFPRDTSNYNYTASLSFLWYAHPGPLAPAADDVFMQGFVALRDSADDPAATAYDSARLARSSPAVGVAAANARGPA